MTEAQEMTDAQVAPDEPNPRADAAVRTEFGEEVALTKQEWEGRRAAEAEAEAPVAHESRWLREWSTRASATSHTLVLARFLEQRGSGLRWESDIEVESIYNHTAGVTVPSKLLISYPAHAHSLVVERGRRYIIEMSQDAQMGWVAVPHPDFSAILVDDEGFVPQFGASLEAVLAAAGQARGGEGR